MPLVPRFAPFTTTSKPPCVRASSSAATLSIEGVAYDVVVDICSRAAVHSGRQAHVAERGSSHAFLSSREAHTSDVQHVGRDG